MNHTSSTEGTSQNLNSSNIKGCADICFKCSQACNESLQYCLEKGGEHASQQHITFLLDCSKICQTSADFLSRNSEQHPITCNACAEICTKCAEVCRQLKDQAMDKCAEICERCSKSCLEMAAH